MKAALPLLSARTFDRAITRRNGYGASRTGAATYLALIDACDNAPFAAVKSGSVDDRDDGRNNRETSQIRVCFGLPCALAGAEPFCDAITSTGSGLRIIHETCMARCWMAPVATVGDDVISATDHGATVKVSSGVQPTLSNETLSAYTNAVGYGVLKSCLAKRRSVESIVSALSAFPLAPFEGEKFSLGIRMRERSSTTPRPAL
jgi:hypothetical protein